MIGQSVLVLMLLLPQKLPVHRERRCAFEIREPLNQSCSALPVGLSVLLLL